MKRGSGFSALVVSVCAAFAVLFAGCDNPTGGNNVPGFVAVTSISGVPDAAKVGIPLALGGTVVPNNASNRAIVWSVESAGSTDATITGSTLHTTAAGTVTVRATIANGTAVGTDFTHDFAITVATLYSPEYWFNFVGGVIQGFNVEYEAAVISIPSSIDGILVTEIGEEAFVICCCLSNEGRTPLISVVIPGSVIHIGDWAFSGNKLTNVTIGNSVTHIGSGAFFGNKLTNVTIPDSVTYIGNGAFFDNKLTNVTIPDSVTIIEMYAFTLNQLANVTIGRNVTEIGWNAFNDNPITNLTIGMAHIEGWAERGLTNVTILDSVTYIGGSAFAQNQLTSVTISNSVTYIGGSAFAENQLTCVTIGSGVTEIGWRAFHDNPITNLTIGMAHIDYTWQEGQLTNVTILDSVTHIGEWAFWQNQLTNVTIGSGVTEIGWGAFYGNQLTSVTIPFATLEAADAVWSSYNWEMIWGPWWRYGIPDDVTWVFAS